MVYSWDGKEAECYRLYVEEKRSLDEVMEYWEQRGFTPSKRAFQTQFKRWDFPSKQNPAHKNPALVARVKELWEKNVMQKDMLDTLLSEGFQINDRELMRLRLRFKWLLRESRGKGTKRRRSGDTSTRKARKPKQQQQQQQQQQQLVRGNGLINQLANTVLQQESPSEGESELEQDMQALVEAPVQPDAEPAPLDPAEVLRRQMRQEQLQQESAEKWRTRKRRRRTRGWAGLPADAPGEPPRFPSETTLDESKAYLNLDNKQYREVREQFQALCEEQGVYKKTIAGPEKWGRVVEQLIRQNTHLLNVFQQDPESLQENGAMWRPRNYKALSLDVICMDVTKRMRTIDTRMSIADAKNVLGLNPEETRQIRSAFYDKLKADHFTNKFEAGEQHWNQLKQAWVQESELLTRILMAGETDPKHMEKLKGIEVLARDVMKRLRHENTQKDPSKKKQIHQGPGPGPAPPSVIPHASKNLRARHEATNTGVSATQNMPTMPSGPDLQIDPSLLLAASDASIIPHNTHAPSHQQLQTQHTHAHDHNPYVMPTQFFHNSPLPIYFRLHPRSSTTMPGKTVWLSILQSGTVAEIRNLAMREHPGTMVMKIEGLMVHKTHGQPDREVMITIDDEDELSAYLEHVASGKATFIVLLMLAHGF